MDDVAVLSDLHIDIDHNAWRDPPTINARVLAVIGDVANPMTAALPWIAKMFASVSHIIYVPGNHDFYCGLDRSTYYQDQMARGREMAASLGITLIQNDVVEIAGVPGVRFAGATTWSDLSILPRGMTVRDAMSQSQKGWYEGGWRNYEKNWHNDFREIKYGGPGSRNRFTPSEMLALHRESVEFFKGVLATPFDGDTVCISHMGPAESVDPTDTHSWLYGWSDLQHLMHGPLAPRYWLHGHVHKSLDYTIGDTRVICNPRGYPGPGGTRENPNFDPHLTIEVGPDLKPGMRI
ncbi:MAG TPA: metallophosphoesterase [Xanthobacteraceae bacterium]|nr:metallophosphoesterase [Xanthobacteraceae bacterium]